MKARKITVTERKILDKLVFPEAFEVLLEETGLQYGELRDDLINLVNFGFVEAYEKKGDAPAHFDGFYDSDNLQRFTFRATSKGLAAIQKPI